MRGGEEITGKLFKCLFAPAEAFVIQFYHFLNKELVRDKYTYKKIIKYVCVFV